MADPLYIPPELWARVAKMLRDYEAGNLVKGSKALAPRSPTDETILIQIVGPAEGGGKYLAKLLKPTETMIDVTEVGAATTQNAGTPFTPASTDAKIIAMNLNEIDVATHTVATSTIVTARIRRRQADGSLIVTFQDGLTPATEKYQVFTPLDDTLMPVWTTMRVQG